MQSFGHKMFIQKDPLTKVVKKYALMLEMSWRPLNMESFGHKC